MSRVYQQFTQNPTSGVRIVDDYSGQHFDVDPKEPGFWAKVWLGTQLTSSGPDDSPRTEYDWREQREVPTGTGWTDRTDEEGGRSGSSEDGNPAYEVNEHDTPDYKVVWMRRGIRWDTASDREAFTEGFEDDESQDEYEEELDTDGDPTSTQEWKFAYEGSDADSSGAGSSGGGGSFPTCEGGYVGTIDCETGEITFNCVDAGVELDGGSP